MEFYAVGSCTWKAQLIPRLARPKESMRRPTRSTIFFTGTTKTVPYWKFELFFFHFFINFLKNINSLPCYHLPFFKKRKKQLPYTYLARWQEKIYGIGWWTSRCQHKQQQETSLCWIFHVGTCILNSGCGRPPDTKGSW